MKIDLGVDTGTKADETRVPDAVGLSVTIGFGNGFSVKC
jgi:hypothetical protein